MIGKKMLKEIKEVSRKCHDGRGAQQEPWHMLVRIDHYNWLVGVAGEFPCKKCGGEGRMRNPRNPIFLPTLDCECGGSGKEYN